MIVALALPWPRVSRPSARSTARWRVVVAARRTTAAPLYCAVIGPTLTLTMPAVLVALDLLELGAGHARGDALDVGEHGPRLLDGNAHPELVGQLHRSQILHGVDVDRLRRGTVPRPRGRVARA